MSKSMEASILEMLEPLVHDDQKIWSIMGGRNMEKCQSILYAWREWLDNHWFEDENILIDKPGQDSVLFNIYSKNVILYYALKGYKFFADSQKESSDRLMKMSIKAHAIELGASYKKPRIIPVDTLRVNIKSIPAFQRADDLFSNPERYLTRDKKGTIIFDKSGWTPDKGEYSSPVFLWQVVSAYEVNIFSHAYFIKALELAKEKKKNVRDDTSTRLE